MHCERIRRSKLLLAVVAALTLALCVPTTGQAAQRGELAFAGTLARGSGYDSPTGSDSVRAVQRRLRRIGDRPGPIDGLYGPLTEGAVERFQGRHGLAVDGIVGRQTKRRLNAPVGQPAAAPAHQKTQPDRLERKSPAPLSGAESAGEPHHARPANVGVASRDGPDPQQGVSPGIVGLLVAFGGLLLLAVLWTRRGRQREASVNLGLACAALLGVFGIGAAGGAIFATQSAPDGANDARAESGVLLAGPAGAHRSRGAPAAPRTPRRAARHATPRRATVVASAAPAAPVAIPAPHPAPARAPVAPRPPAVPRAYVVKPGDSLSAIARKELVAGGSDVSLVQQVEKLAQLNLDGRIQSGDPNLIEAGEELRLR